MPEPQPITQRLATKALITNGEGKILILREASTYEEGTNHGRYHLPGGRLNPGEPFLDGLQREVYEETGLRIEVGPPIHVGEWWPVIKSVPHQIVAVFFICRALGTKITLSDEHDDFKWITPQDAATYDIMAPEDDVIATYARI